MLQIDQSLTIPGSGPTVVEPPLPEKDAKPKPKPAPVPAQASSDGLRRYTIRSGDRILFIAKRFGVSPDELMAINHIKDATKIQAGQELKIPPSRK